MAARPPQQDSSSPDAVEFGIAALVGHLDHADLEYPATSDEIVRALEAEGYVHERTIKVAWDPPEDQPLPDRYYGYYHRYFYAGAGDNAVTKSLVNIFPENGRAVWKNVELANRPSFSNGPRNTLKYSGEVVLLTDRIHVVEYEMLGARNFCYTILYPAYGNHLTWLNGLQTWLALSPGRHPTAATVALKFLGRRVDVRKALASCGVLQDDDPELDRDAVARLHAVNRTSPAAVAVNEAST